jgi:AcrR family transcriptional regulator
MTSDLRAAGKPSRRRPRNSLTAQEIVEESLRLLDKHGIAGFSLPKLGRALGSDPTALYRHFSSKDDLVLAIADRLIEESMEGLEPSDCWVTTLVDVAQRLRRTYCAHSAAASLSACRTTRRPAEMRAVDVIIGAVLRAGFTGARAAVIYRAYGDFVLSFAGGEASFLSLDPDVQEADRSAWVGAYLTAGRAEHPNIWRIRTALPDVEDDQIFETILDLVMGGLRGCAPNPCGCDRHATGRT